jgi:hypothetical protein
MSLIIGFLGSRKNSLIEARLLAGILRRFRIVLSITGASSICEFNVRAGNRPEKTALVSMRGVIVWLSGRLDGSPLSVVGKEDPKKVEQDVVAFRKNFQNVHYCFGSP